jgi:hypothetical protein
LKNDVNVPSKSSKQKNNTSYARTSFKGRDLGPCGTVPTYSFNPDPDPGFFVKTDPDPVRHTDPGFDAQKFKHFVAGKNFLQKLQEPYITSFKVSREVVSGALKIVFIFLFRGPAFQFLRKLK